MRSPVRPHPLKDTQLSSGPLELFCDVDGATLSVRPDDQPAVVAARLANQMGLLEALLDYYRADERLVTVDGEGPVDEVATRMLRAGSRAFRLIRD